MFLILWRTFSDFLAWVFFFYLLLSFSLSVDSANFFHVQCSAFVHIRLLSSEKEAEQNLLRILLWFCRTIYMSHIRNAHIANAPISFRQWCKHIWLFSLSTINLDTLFFLHKWTDFEAYTTLSRVYHNRQIENKLKCQKKSWNKFCETIVSQSCASPLSDRNQWFMIAHSRGLTIDSRCCCFDQQKKLINKSNICCTHRSWVYRTEINIYDIQNEALNLCLNRI